MKLPAIRGRLVGSSHNRAAEPGRLEVTIWGFTDRRWFGPRREMAIILDEDAARQLVRELGQFGFYAP